jgi:hypothetical protein
LNAAIASAERAYLEAVAANLRRQADLEDITVLFEAILGCGEVGVRGIDRLLDVDAMAAVKLVIAVTTHGVTLIAQDQES